METEILTVASVALPVDEKLEIKKHRIKNLKKVTGKEKRFSVVTGIHGDELEGQYVCYELARRLNENISHLEGIVDIYPALNPMGIDSVTRGIPAFDLDMNRIFPGANNGSMAEHVASKIIEDLYGSDACVDIHASNIYLTEIPQIRISEPTAEKLVPMAEKMNVNFIWVHGAATVLEATLAHSLNTIGVPTLVVEMGVGMRITRKYGNQIVEGILSLMKDMGMWSGDTIEPMKPLISREDSDVSFINATVSGIFLPAVDHYTKVKKGDLVGEIVDPLNGVVLDSLLAPCDGIVFTIREYPVVDEGSLISRILGGEF